MNDCELILFISGIACTLAKCHTDAELSLLASTFTQLGDSLATIVAQREFCSNNEKEV